jgi:hypothetical protein
MQRSTCVGTFELLGVLHDNYLLKMGNQSEGMREAATKATNTLGAGTMNRLILLKFFQRRCA